MTRLSIVSILVGVFIIASRLPGVLAPGKFREFALKFPRSLVWGRALMGIVALIVWWVMYHAATEEWAWARPLIVGGVPVAYWMVWQYGTHFLAVRAAAALMLLVAKQMVTAADWSESSLRLVVTVFAYIWVVTAIWITIAPHHVRDLLGWVMANDKRCRTACLVGATVGAVLVGLGVFAY